jgi:hypothetical protein
MKHDKVIEPASHRTGQQQAEQDQEKKKIFKKPPHIDSGKI